MVSVAFDASVSLIVCVRWRLGCTLLEAVLTFCATVGIKLTKRNPNRRLEREPVMCSHV